MMYSEKKYRYKFSLGQSGNSLMILVAINLIVFILFAFIKAIYFFHYEDNDMALAFYNENILSWFTMPSEGSRILARPWTLLTQMFMHDGIWQVIANMLWLGLFGSILQSLTGNKKLVPVFIYGGLAGAVAFALAYNLLPSLQAGVNVTTLLGSSASVIAVAVVTTLLSPDYRIFPMLNGGIPLWIITILYLIIDLATIPVNNPGGHIAHLGGAIIGVLFMFFLRQGYDGSQWMSNFFEGVNNLFNPDKPRKGKEIKKRLFYKTSSQPFTKTSNFAQERVDEILDKINQKGYDFLTEEEKEILKQASKEDL